MSIPQFRKVERTMRIIFLDIDGVLNSNAFFDTNPDNVEIDNTFVERLVKLYNTYPDTKIVLSSYWRYLSANNKSKQYFYSKMKENNLDVIDETPLSYPGTTQFINNRPIEIKLWLNDHPEIKKWVSIEDDFLYEHYEKECGKQFANHLVTTLFYGNTDNEGLTEDAVNKAIKILK